jgi:hypothetical protein
MPFSVFCRTVTRPSIFDVTVPSFMLQGPTFSRFFAQNNLWYNISTGRVGGRGGGGGVCVWWRGKGEEVVHPVQMYGVVNHEKNSQDLWVSVCVTQRWLCCEWQQAFRSLKKLQIDLFRLTILNDIPSGPTIYFQWQYRMCDDTFNGHVSMPTLFMQRNLQDYKFRQELLWEFERRNYTIADFLRQGNFSKIWCFHGGDYEEFLLLGFCAVGLL